MCGPIAEDKKAMIASRPENDEVVPRLVEVEVMVPRLTPAVW